jgi:cbb3-type cytochrome oxidase maturation protein
MIILWILFIGSVVVLPGTALLAFWWAARQGEFDHLQKTALSIFDEDEPVGQLSDHFPLSAPLESLRFQSSVSQTPKTRKGTVNSQHPTS